MKKAMVLPSRYMTFRRDTYTPYPGVQAPVRFGERLLNAALAAAITLGVVVIFLFLAALA